MTNYATNGVNMRVELTDCSDKTVYQEYENVKVINCPASAIDHIILHDKLFGSLRIETKCN